MGRLRHVHLLAWILVMTVAAAFLPQPAAAQTLLERLVMPGDLIEGHARLEEDCANCHTPFQQKSQNRLCLDCHKAVRTDIAADQGFHGRHPAVADTQCKHCHTDHQGRGADILRFNPRGFDHRFSDFTIDGAHATADCSGCHASGEKYRAAPDICISCHRDDDAHGGKLGEDCADCHTTTAWRAAAASFDHLQTRFALTGAHREVPCQGCHLGEVYKDTPTACADCHQVRDVHGGRFGSRCESCHETVKWTAIRFDHDRDTKFALTGAHRETGCNACHLGNAYEKDAGQLCIDCHREDDVHDGLNGRDCKACHNSTDWTVSSFDHGKTRFALRGAHAAAPCETCHVRPADEVALPMACISCHARKDVHAGRFGARCGDCHTETSWRSVRFDHARTRFPLRGAHARTGCKSCHTSPSAKVRLETGCNACHARDDPHKGALGRDCARCHDEKKWRQNVFFDHGLTALPLIGLHAAVPCEECHVSQVFSETAGGCIDCHAAKDIHNGALGRDCAGCHNPNGWDRWLFDHAGTGFALTGEHEKIACADCHRGGVTARATTKCVDCHRRDDVHRRGFGRRCERCHATESWRPVQ